MIVAADRSSERLQTHERPTLQQMSSGGEGWECPRCGCHDWRVVDSRFTDGARRRIRACRHCHQVLRTVEQVADEAE